MSDLHEVHIWVDERGAGVRVEIDGREIYGVTGIEFECGVDDGARVYIELRPRLLTIEGAAHVEAFREIVPVADATAERRQTASAIMTITRDHTELR